MTLLDFQLIIIITVTIPVALLNWFSWNPHGWWESAYGWILFFENNRFNKTTDMGENVPPKLVFWLSFSQYVGFWGKNFKAIFGTPISHRKGYIHFCGPTPHSKKSGHAVQKLFFTVILENIAVFEKIVEWEIIKTSFLTKKFILIFVARHSIPLKMVMSSHEWFFAIF